MKRLFFLLCLTIMWACQENEEIILSERLLDTRSITTMTSPVFDWWDTTSVSLPGLANPVVLPWYNGANTQIPYYLLEEYEPKDGWEMVYNYCINYLPGELNKNYLIFYNKFTGILRIFYYNNNQIAPSSVSFWRFEITASTSMLNATGIWSMPMSERVSSPYVYVSNITSVPSKSISMGWNCFDVELAYDDQIINKNARFNINIYNIDKEKIKLSGDLQIETEGVIVTATSSSFPAWTRKSSKVAGDEAKGFLQKMLKKTSLNGKISSIVSGGVSSLVENGVGRLLGSIVGKKDNTYNSQVKLTSTGEVKINGELEALNLPNISTLMKNPMPGTRKQANDNFLPSYDLPLGVWSVEELPAVYLCPVRMWGLNGLSSQQSQGVYIGLVHQEDLLYYEPDSIKIKINPALLHLVEKYETKIEYVWTVKTSSPHNYSSEYNTMSGPRGYCAITTDTSVMLLPTSLTTYTFNPPSTTGKVGFRYCYFNYLPIQNNEIPLLLTGTTSFPPLQYNAAGYGALMEAIQKQTICCQITLTLYPKAPYDQTPVVLMRTYPVRYGGMDNNFRPDRWDLKRFVEKPL